MTATRSATTRAQSAPGLLRLSTFALAAAVALEIAGLRALGPSTVDMSTVVASVDGTSVDTPAAVTPRVRVPSVGFRVVAQIDTPAN